MSEDNFVHETAPTPRWILVVLGVLFVGVGYLLYAGYTTRTALWADVEKSHQRTDMLEAQLNQANERLAEVKGQLEVTSEKLGLTQQELARARSLAQTIAKDQKASDAQLRAQLGEAQQQADQKIGEVATQVSEARTDLSAARKDLAATIARLESTIGDLGVQSGLIARNREELEALKRLGERNIFEFDLRKSKDLSRVGPIQLALRKVDTKKYKYNLDVYSDDKRIEKKDKTLMEPVQFYVKGAKRPFEIVIFEVQKDRAVGYLSTPKGT